MEQAQDELYFLKRKFHLSIEHSCSTETQQFIKDLRVQDIHWENMRERYLVATSQDSTYTFLLTPITIGRFSLHLYKNSTSTLDKHALAHVAKLPCMYSHIQSREHYYKSDTFPSNDLAILHLFFYDIVILIGKYSYEHSLLAYASKEK